MKRSVALLAFLLLAGLARAEAVVGEPAPPFTLADLTGTKVSLADFRGRTVVLEWHNFGCPFVQKHYGAGNMQALQERYGKDVAWLVVNSTHAGSRDYLPPVKVASRLRELHAAPTRYLIDEAGAVGRAYGAKTTPHMFVIDAKGTVVYNGAIDDKRSADPADIEGARNYVAAALDEMRAGKPVSTPSTAPYGCSVHYK